MADFLEQWTSEDQERAKLTAQKALITQVTEAIWQAMDDAHTSKTELAARMGASKGYVSQVLSGSRNMTLRTLSDICFALGRKPSVAVRAQTDDSGRQDGTASR